MTTTQYDLKRGGIVQKTSLAVLVPEIPVSNPVINLEQRLIAKLRRSGLMIGLSFEGDWLKLTLFGVITRGATSSFKEFSSQIFESGYFLIKVDLSGVERIDGNGLAVLIWMTTQASQRSGQVSVYNPKTEVRNVMLAARAQFMLDLGDYNLAAS